MRSRASWPGLLRRGDVLEIWEMRAYVWGWAEVEAGAVAENKRGRVIVSIPGTEWFRAGKSGGVRYRVRDPREVAAYAEQRRLLFSMGVEWPAKVPE